ncbi:multiple stress resistance protein BhsA [Yersinia aldovae]|uniref:Multiple stress resistance protein BhsA n=1 Tax=Yersinia aldovae TaxID=29483 RepID=A0A0T9T9T7_YERAL|nr:YdgH/BhsA/McbA-like domain containing protein [Yersinia aldovae]CNI93158.1 Multiple stress resistance protein BhsA precursor [Yersinia aldovae]CNK69879.1 Multiple stress resistance protein BhsA precursor [Yersinia aldovae]CNK90163.1 Multiple stress resistance protein BhsA precursor [Yersinia aldovae]
MKIIKSIAPALVLSLASFGSFAATQVQQQSSVELNKIGTISASNAGTLTELESLLAQKADAAQAKSFQITSASGNNKLHGTATIYR